MTFTSTVAEAFASVQYLMTDVNFGWLIRSIHRWSASMMVLMMILHVCRVYRVVSNVHGVNMGKWCSDGSMHGIIWCYWLLFTMGPNWLLGCKIVTGVQMLFQLLVVQLLNYYVVCRCGSINFNTFLQSTYFCFTIATAVFMLMHFLMIRKQGISGPL
jgi:cytochrome b6